MEKFKLKTEFVDKYTNLVPPFGFNGLGEIVYLRTYSRLKENGKNEKWHETVERVVNGVYNIQKEHILSYNLGWDEQLAHESAEQMYDKIFNMKFLPSGRSLWAMGTSIIDDKKLYAALNACSFVSTKNIGTEYSKPFEYMMDMSMLGVGVGFDTRGANQLTILKPSEDNFFFQIPDTREGWVESLKHALNAFLKGYPIPKFDYSLIRPYGKIIKTFGGKSAGPQPLIDLHIAIENILFPCIGKEITITNIVDIMNLIGACVVAGNVRRTAQIVFSDTNEEYLKLKDYIWDTKTESYKGTNSRRAKFGWTSNNSIFAKIGMDYTKVAEQTASNGEPGYFWLDNAQQFSRINEKDNKDFRAEGANPCNEQTLESYEMCCLVETFPNKHTDKKDYFNTLKYAYLFAKTVTLGQCHWPETNRVQLRNRRIGTSVSGVAQFLENRSIDELKIWLREGYDVIKRYDDIYSDWLAIPKSIKVTSVKPSGTVSLLAGATPGMHFPESNYYIRRIRIAKNSDLIEPLRKSGYKIEQAVDDPETTFVVEFPIFVGNCKTINQVTIWEQLLLASFFQEHWADNQVSCTVTFKEWEKDQIKTALDYFQYKLKGISFLPKASTINYPQMPYEEISKEEYENSINNIVELQNENITEDSKLELFCDNESCIYV